MTIDSTATGAASAAVRSRPPARAAAAAWALPLLVVVPMLALASALGTHAIIFPEGAALAMGVWSLALPGWAESRWRVAVLPALCALLGVGTVALDLPGHAAPILAAVLAVLVLQLADSRLAPALSAAVLPAVFGVGNLSYPLAVLAICAVIAAAMPWLSRRRGASPVADDRSGRYAWEIVVASLAVTALWMLLGGELLALPAAALAPPLFVSALEWLGQRACTLRRGLRRWTLLVAAALAGALAAKLIATPWLAGVVAVGATLVIMALLATPHPPALAIALIPQLLGVAQPLDYTLAIAAGAAAMYLGVLAAHRIALRPSSASAARSMI